MGPLQSLFDKNDIFISLSGKKQPYFLKKKFCVEGIVFLLIIHTLHAQAIWRATEIVTADWVLLLNPDRRISSSYSGPLLGVCKHQQRMTTGSGRWHSLALQLSCGRGFCASGSCPQCFDSWDITWGSMPPQRWSQGWKCYSSFAPRGVDYDPSVLLLLTDRLMPFQLPSLVASLMVWT
jgi:hypothetical protein